MSDVVRLPPAAGGLRGVGASEMQRVLPENVILNIQENSGQITIGNYVMQLGSGYGALVQPVLRSADRLRADRMGRQDRSVRVLPFPSLFLDRLAETETALQYLQQGQSVGVYGPSGIGKTSLLAYLLQHTPEQAFPDGLVYLSGRRKLKDDLLQELFDTFYPQNNLTLKPTYLQIQRTLRDKKFLLVLDDVALSRAELKEFQLMLPNCTLLLASVQPYGQQEGQALPLVGLPLENGLELLEAELGRALTSEELLAARVLWAALGGHPNSLRQAAALVRENRYSMSEVAYQSQQTNPQQGLAALHLAALGEPEKRVLQLLAALEGAALSTEHLAALTGLPDITSLLEALSRQGLVQAFDSRYRLPRYLGQLLFLGLDLTPHLERGLTHFILWAEGQRSKPALLLPDLEAILQILAWAVKAERWAEVLRLVRAVDTALALSRGWTAWEEVLQAGLQAAQAANNQLAEAWVLHQLGSRALCLGETRLARLYLSQALQLRETLGDKVGIVITRANLNLLPPASSPDLTPSNLEKRSLLKEVGPLPVTMVGLVTLLPVLVLAGLGLARWNSAASPLQGGASGRACLHPGRSCFGEGVSATEGGWAPVVETLVVEATTQPAAAPSPNLGGLTLAPFTGTPAQPGSLNSHVLSSAPPSCVEFDALPPRSYNPYDSFEEAGVLMTIEPLLRSAGPEVRPLDTTSGVRPPEAKAVAPALAEIELYGDDFTPVQRLRLQNASLRVTLPPFSSGLSLLFSHLNGNLKLDINGISEDFTNFTDLNDRTIGKVKISVQPETEFSGRVSFIGKVETFTLGGQELWLDTLCLQ